MFTNLKRETSKLSQVKCSRQKQNCTVTSHFSPQPWHRAVTTSLLIIGVVTVGWTTCWSNDGNGPLLTGTTFDLFVTGFVSINGVRGPIKGTGGGGTELFVKLFVVSGGMSGGRVAGLMFVVSGGAPGGVIGLLLGIFFISLPEIFSIPLLFSIGCE